MNIDNLPLEVDYRDSGQWRSYEVQSEGDTLEELLDNCHVFEIDQDGGELDDYPLNDASNEVWQEAEKVITNHVRMYEGIVI